MRKNAHQTEMKKLTLDSNESSEIQHSKRKTKESNTLADNPHHNVYCLWLCNFVNVFKIIKLKLRDALQGQRVAIFYILHMFSHFYIHVCMHGKTHF